MSESGEAATGASDALEKKPDSSTATAVPASESSGKRAMESDALSDREPSPTNKKSRVDSPPTSGQFKPSQGPPGQNSRDKFWFELCRMKEEEYNDMSIPDFLRVKCGNPHEKSIFSKRLEWYRSLKSQGALDKPLQPPPEGDPTSHHQVDSKEGSKSSPGSIPNPSDPSAATSAHATAAQMQYNNAYQQYYSHHHYPPGTQGPYPGYPPSFPPPWVHHPPPPEGANGSPPQGPPGMPPGMMAYHYPPPHTAPPPYGAPQPPEGSGGGSPKNSPKEEGNGDSKQAGPERTKGISPEGRLVVSEIKSLLGLTEEDSETGLSKASAAAAQSKLQGSDDIPPQGCRDVDVLFGRGGAMRKHHGNVVFRGLVKKCQPAYIGAAEKNDKMLIARLIIQAVRKLGGRFLKKNDNSGVWEDVDEFRVRTKISQALREGAPQLREAQATKHRQPPASQMHGHPMHNPSVGHQHTAYSSQQRLQYLPHTSLPPGAGVPPMWIPHPHHAAMVGAPPYPYQQSPPSQMHPTPKAESEPNPSSATSKDAESQDPASEEAKAETAETLPLPERPLGVVNGSLNIDELKEVLGLADEVGKDPKKPNFSDADVYVPGEEDVLMQGSDAPNHPGNLYYSSLLSKCLPAYYSIRVCKDLIAGLVVDAVHHRGGRFLDLPKNQGEVWKQVEDAAAISWVLADLRSGEKMFEKLHQQSVSSVKEESDDVKQEESKQTIKITNKDVLMGRGSSANHFGNVRFRTYCRAVQPAYVNAPFNKDKTLIAKLVVQTVELTGGRFLDTDEETGALTIVDKEKARQKTAQAVQTIQKLRYRKERKGKQNEPEEYLDKRPPGINKEGDLDVTEIKSLLATTASIREPPQDEAASSEPEQEKVLGQKRKLDPKELDALLTLSSMEQSRASEVVKEESSDGSEDNDVKPDNTKLEASSKSSAIDGSPQKSRRVSTDAEATSRRSSPRRSPPTKRSKTDEGEENIDSVVEKLVGHVKNLQDVGDRVGLSYNVLKTYIQEYAKGVEPPLKNFRVTRAWMEDVFQQNNITLENWD